VEVGIERGSKFLVKQKLCGRRKGVEKILEGKDGETKGFRSTEERKKRRESKRREKRIWQMDGFFGKKECIYKIMEFRKKEDY
jgi:hypothetical protein